MLRMYLGDLYMMVTNLCQTVDNVVQMITWWLQAYARQLAMLYSWLHDGYKLTPDSWQCCTVDYMMVTSLCQTVGNGVQLITWWLQAYARQLAILYSWLHDGYKLMPDSWQCCTVDYMMVTGLCQSVDNVVQLITWWLQAYARQLAVLYSWLHDGYKLMPDSWQYCTVDYMMVTSLCQTVGNIVQLITWWLLAYARQLTVLYSWLHDGYRLMPVSWKCCTVDYMMVTSLCQTVDNVVQLITWWLQAYARQLTMLHSYYMMVTSLCPTDDNVVQLISWWLQACARQLSML